MVFPIKQIKTLLYFWLTPSLLLIALSAVLKAQLEVHEKDSLFELKEELIELYEEDGIAHLEHEYEFKRGQFLNQNQSIVLLTEEHYLFALYNNQALIAGSQLLKPNGLFEVTQFKLTDNEQQAVQGYRIEFRLDEDYSLIFIKAESERKAVANAFLNKLTLMYICISLPIIIGFILFANTRQKRVTNKFIKEISTIAKSPDSKRLSSIAQDSELTQVANAINQLLDEITHLHTNMKTMSVGIAHDLKTPLTRVANRIQSMHQDINCPELLTSHLEHVSTDLHSTINTFNNLVRLNAIESGQHKEGFKVLDLSSLVLELGESFEPVFSDAGKQLEISVTDKVRCFGDADLLNQLIFNLLENALEYSNPEAKVWLRLQSHTTGALLQVGDSGPGIEKALHQKVFQRFFRADHSRTTPGNGLGLSIVKAICDIHGAKITLLKDQSGAVFNIELPNLKV